MTNILSAAERDQPAYARAGQTLVELFDVAFDGARANRIALLTKLLVLHPPLMGLE